MPLLPIAWFALLGALASCAMAACGSDGADSGQAGSGGGEPLPEDAGPDADASHEAESSGPRPATMLGARCKGDGDCGEGLFCSAPYSTDWKGGGPAHGYCTKDCSQDGDSACTVIEPASFCHGPADAVRLCIQGCSPGGQASELDFDIMKCWARQDVACSQTGTEETPGGLWGCWPTCGDDTDCPASACDRGTGLCVDGLEAGLGAECFIPCLARCVIGDPDACGFPLGICIGAGDHPATFGDQGYCAQTCEIDDDCLGKESGLFCDHDSVPGVGVCNWLGSPGTPDAG